MAHWKAEIKPVPVVSLKFRRSLSSISGAQKRHCWLWRAASTFGNVTWISFGAGRFCVSFMQQYCRFGCCPHGAAITCLSSISYMVIRRWMWLKVMNYTNNGKNTYSLGSLSFSWLNGYKIVLAMLPNMFHGLAPISRSNHCTCKVSSMRFANWPWFWWNGHSFKNTAMATTGVSNWLYHLKNVVGLIQKLFDTINSSFGVMRILLLRPHIRHST
jgi:hypothetical protein